MLLPKLPALLSLEERDRSSAASSSPSAPVPLLRLKMHLQRAKFALHLRDSQTAARDLEALDALVLCTRLASPRLPHPMHNTPVHQQLSQSRTTRSTTCAAAGDAPEASGDPGASAKYYEPALCFLRAQYEYQLGNTQNALKLLMRAGALAKPKTKPGARVALTHWAHSLLYA